VDDKNQNLSLIGTENSKYKKKTPRSYFEVIVGRCNKTSQNNCSDEPDIQKWTQGKTLHMIALNYYQDLNPDTKLKYFQQTPVYIS
jgi:hypothetical protein